LFLNQGIALNRKVSFMERDYLRRIDAGIHLINQNTEQGLTNVDFES
jgi:hypothetical protein